MGGLCSTAKQPGVMPVGMRQKFEAAGQAHVFEYLKDAKALTVDEKETLYSDLQTFDPDYVCKTLYENRDHAAKAEEGVEDELDRIEPELTMSTADMNLEENKEEREKMFQVGLDLIKQGKVTTVILAGGQGSRLGSSDPKGMFNIDMPS